MATVTAVENLQFSRPKTSTDSEVDWQSQDSGRFFHGIGFEKPQYRLVFGVLPNYSVKIIRESCEKRKIVRTF